LTHSLETAGTDAKSPRITYTWSRIWRRFHLGHATPKSGNQCYMPHHTQKLFPEDYRKVPLTSHNFRSSVTSATDPSINCAHPTEPRKGSILPCGCRCHRHRHLLLHPRELKEISFISCGSGTMTTGTTATGTRTMVSPVFPVDSPFHIH
jgi:hypothetical protein